MQFHTGNSILHLDSLRGVFPVAATPAGGRRAAALVDQFRRSRMLTVTARARDGRSRARESRYDPVQGKVLMTSQSDELYFFTTSYFTIALPRLKKSR